MKDSEIGTFFFCTSFATQCAPGNCPTSQPRQVQREWPPKMHGGLRVTSYGSLNTRNVWDRKDLNGTRPTQWHQMRPELAQLAGHTAPQPHVPQGREGHSGTRLTSSQEGQPQPRSSERMVTVLPSGGPGCQKINTLEGSGTFFFRFLILRCKR